jgi:uncharacterized protein YyaL (SSP411 family)
MLRWAACLGAALCFAAIPPTVSSQGQSPMGNLLQFEKSPYLLQHAHNPVQWMPWGEEAFAKAKAEDKPLLISIGYSTCHWCHVMEHESFEDPAVAELMNKYLVCVKVDREERPDVDRVYMNAVTALTGQGGWPLNCFVTPEGKPFYGGTYFPPKPMYQRPSWSMLVEGIGKAWADPGQRLRVIKDAETLTAALKRLEEKSEPADALKAAWLDDGLAAFRRAYDSQQGGFAQAPKFPMPVNQHLLLRLAHRYAKEGKTAEAAESAEMALNTLRHMAQGGIYDQLGGGFARYSVDERWHVPHFEKMLYDNAQLASNYLEAYQMSHDPAFLAVARGILDYLLRDMSAAGGGFYSAEDADSLPPGEAPGSLKREGAFYVWEKSELTALLGVEAADRFANAYGVKADGNVESDPHGEFPHKNVLYRNDRLGSLVGQDHLSGEALDQDLEASRQKLFAARALRPRPQRDEKVLAGWNGLALRAFAQAAQVTGDARYLKAAEDSAAFFHEKMWEPNEGLLYRRFADGERKVEGQADDYTYMASGLLALYQADFNPAWLAWAETLMKAARTRFYDDSDGLYFLAGRTGDPRLPARVKDSHDNVEPAPASVAVENQLLLWSLTGEDAWRADAERTLRGHGAAMERAPRALPYMLGDLDAFLNPPDHVVIAGKKGDASTQAMLKVLRREFRPGLAVLLAEPGQALPGYAQGFKSEPGQAWAYVCQGFSCQAPVKDAAALAAALKGD